LARCTGFAHDPVDDLLPVLLQQGGSLAQNRCALFVLRRRPRRLQRSGRCRGSRHVASVSVADPVRTDPVAGTSTSRPALAGLRPEVKIIPRQADSIMNFGVDAFMASSACLQALVIFDEIYRVSRKLNDGKP
jgi:hypothetical protein